MSRQRRRHDRLLVEAAARLSESAFRKVWDNPDDAKYDRYDPKGAEDEEKREEDEPQPGDPR